MMMQPCSTSSLSFLLCYFLSTTLCLIDGQSQKQGVAFRFAHSCTVLDNMEASTWYYTWGSDGGFDDSFCSTPDESLSYVLDILGMEFVPMFWNEVPRVRQLDSKTKDMLNRANYFFAFNEPEQSGQANLTPLQAAQQWRNVEDIAKRYKLQIIAPCMTQDKGRQWFADFTTECNNLYNRNCMYDYLCLHLFYQPYPCDVGSDYSWACIGENGIKATNKLQEWYNLYEKEIWVNEYSCAPWGSTDECTPEEHMAINEQLTPILQNDPNVFRYSWFELQSNDREWPGNSLNVDIWDTHKGVLCSNWKWIGGFGTDANWKIQTKQQCLELAENDEECYVPISLSIDDQNCYCSKDECTNLESSYPSMRTYNQHDNYISDTTPIELSTIGKVYEQYGSNLDSFCMTLVDEDACVVEEAYCTWNIFIGCEANSYAPRSTLSPSVSTQPSSAPITSEPTISLEPSSAPITTAPCPPCTSITNRDECTNCNSCKWKGSRTNGSCS